ncbi:hypothetical protein V1517DRAFT_290732 [Lipomyces orientalis]|uniref:Uncharacterized protein n=1 Tax=Lipomyces orientalis TaxID=1233043 RepID=A0ACC3TNN0_9ASCO
MQRLRVGATSAILIEKLIQPSRTLVAVQQRQISDLTRVYTTRSRCLLAASDSALQSQPPTTGRHRTGRFTSTSAFQSSRSSAANTVTNNGESESAQLSPTVGQAAHSDDNSAGIAWEEPGNQTPAMKNDRQSSSRTEYPEQSFSASSSDSIFAAENDPVAKSSTVDINNYDAMAIFDSTLQQAPEDFPSMQWDDSHLFKNLLGAEDGKCPHSFLRRYHNTNAKTEVLEEVMTESGLFPAEEIHVRAQAVEESPPAKWVNLPDSQVEQLARQVLGKKNVRLGAFVSESKVSTLRRNNNKVLKELSKSFDVQIQLASNFVPYNKQDRLFQVSGMVENVAKTFASLSRVMQNVSLSTDEDRKLRILLIVTYRVAGGILRGPQTLASLQQISGATITVSENLLFRSTDRILIVTAHNSRSLYLAVWEICKFIAPPEWIHEVSAISKTQYKSYVGVRPPSARLTNRRQGQGNLDRSNPMKLDEESAPLKKVTITIPKMHVGFVMGKNGVFQSLVRQKTGAYVTIHPDRPRQTVNNESDGDMNAPEIIAGTGEPGEAQEYQVQRSGDYKCVIRSNEWSRVQRAAFMYRNRIELAEARYRRLKNEQMI